jgi:hypothetical protein
MTLVKGFQTIGEKGSGRGREGEGARVSRGGGGELTGRGGDRRVRKRGAGLGGRAREEYGM